MLNKISTWTKDQGFIRYFKNTTWMMAEQCLRIVSGLLVGVWVARYLGPEEFGLLSYALAFTAILGGVAKLGLDGIVVRELVNQPEKRDSYLGTAFWLKVIGAIVAVGLVSAIVPLTNNDDTTNLYIFIISIGLIFQSFEVVEFYFQSQVLGKIISICKVTQLLLSSLIKIYLVLTQADLVWFVLVTVFDTSSLAVSYLIAYKLQKTNTFFKHFDFCTAKKLLTDSWSLILSSILIMIYMRIDQIMIKEMLGEHEVGIYSAAVRLSEAFYFIPVLITASIFPAVLNAKNQSEELFNQRFLQLYRMMVWIAVSIALPMTFVSDWIVIQLFGLAYEEAGQVLMIHIWASVFVFLGVASSKWFIAQNIQRFTLINTFIGAILNIALNLYFIPMFGVVGAAYATVISYGISAFLLNSVWKVCRPNFVMQMNSFILIWKVK
ncbi:flippase [Vibrio breoganii]